MENLSPAQIEEFLSRFERFFDTVLVGFALEFPHGITHCQMKILSRDNSGTGWSEVEIRLEEVKSCRFDVAMNTAFNILSHGMHLWHDNELFYVDMGHFVEAPNSAARYLESPFHFVARSIRWSASEIG